VPLPNAAKAGELAAKRAAIADSGITVSFINSPELNQPMAYFKLNYLKAGLKSSSR